MGGPNATLSIEGCVQAIGEVIQNVLKTKKCNGLYKYDGSIVDHYTAPAVLQEIFDFTDYSWKCNKNSAKRESSVISGKKT